MTRPQAIALVAQHVVAYLVDTNAFEDSLTDPDDLSPAAWRDVEALIVYTIAQEPDNRLLNEALTFLRNERNSL